MVSVIRSVLVDEDNCEGFIEFDDGCRCYGTEKRLILVKPCMGKPTVIDQAYKGELSLDPYASLVGLYSELGGWSQSSQATTEEAAEYWKVVSS